MPDHPWRYLLHDRDAIFSASLDATARSFGLAILKSPPRCPKANAFCERLIGTAASASTGSFRSAKGTCARSFVNGPRTTTADGPHTALRSVPEPASGTPAELQAHRHRLPDGQRAIAKPVLAACITSTRSPTRRNGLAASDGTPAVSRYLCVHRCCAAATFRMNHVTSPQQPAPNRASGRSKTTQPTRRTTQKHARGLFAHHSSRIRIVPPLQERTLRVFADRNYPTPKRHPRYLE